MATTHSVIVIGAGISGLACAYALKKSGADVLLLESSPSPGGIIHSVKDGGFLFETGPQSFSATPALNALINDLALSDELVAAPPRAPRYIFVNGQLRSAPLSPPALLASSLLGWPTKLSLLREPFRKTVPPLGDESIADFVRRKFSPDLLDLLVGPFVSGIYAGNPEKLSLRAAFPQIHEAEQTAGSVIRGLKAAAKSKNPPGQKPTLVSFRNGNETLTQALSHFLGKSLRTGAHATQISRNSSNQFEITTTIDSSSAQFRSPHLVLATSAQIAASLLQQLAPAAAQVLSQIEYAPVAVVSLAYRRADVAHALNGFGFLVPRAAGLRILGTVWNSSLFPNRAPQDHVLLTCFLGGATDPDTTSLSNSSLIDLAHRELTPILGLKAQPVASRVTAHRQAIPQYNLGHLDRLAAIQSDIAKIPGLHLTGNYFRGPAVGACVEHGQSVAESIRINADRSEAAVSHPEKPLPGVPFWVWSAIVVLLVFTLYTSRETIHLNKQIAETTAQANAEIAKRNQLKERFALAQREAIILTDPRTVKITLTAENENLPDLKAMWHAKLGIVVAGQSVPMPQGNRTFQLWLIPKDSDARPIPSLTWRPDAEGKFLLLVANPPDAMEATKSLAITEEPAGGSQALTTKPIWVGAII